MSYVTIRIITSSVFLSTLMCCYTLVMPLIHSIFPIFANKNKQHQDSNSPALSPLPSLLLPLSQPRITQTTCGARLSLS